MRLYDRINRRTTFLGTAALAALGWANAAQAQNDYVWIESQETSAISVKNDKIKTEVSGWGNKQFLSGESWFQVKVENGADADKVVPDEGIVLSYKINLPKGGQQEIWNRIGYEFVRSPFDWRVDGGEWARIEPDKLTTDLMALAVWTEVAWLKLGEKQLDAGAHTLEIRLPKTKNAKGETQRVLYASDVLLVTPTAFAPNSKYKPGENYRDERDEAATKNAFTLPEPKAPGERATVQLKGDWEIARADEELPREPDAPMSATQDMPRSPYWKSIAVPSDKNTSRPDLLFAHRLWYRTRVSVPASQAGRGFVLTFPHNSLMTTVVVNGQECGFNRTPFARFSVDVSKAIKPGVNEIRVGIKDAWYGFTRNPNNPMKLRRMFNYPAGDDWFHKGFMDLAYPIWNNPQSGLLEAPEFSVAGAVYASDVFPKPSVANKQMVADITLTNTTAQAQQGEIRWQAVHDKTGAVEKTFAAKPFTLPANGEQVVSIADAWANAQLWWPDAPQLYRLRTTVAVGGQPLDVQETTFGFREWTTRGIDFMLNGVRWQMWADLTPLGAKTPDEFLKLYNSTNQRTFRLMMPGQGGGNWRYLGMTLPDVLSFFDRNGVLVRRNGPLDGEAIGYQFSENDEDLKKLYGTNVKMQLMENWRAQMVQQVKGERNHPSIHLWTIENEFAYINLINLLGNSPTMDAYEKEIQKTSDAVQAVDPTRPVMIDGGGALKDNTLPVHGDHYVFTANDPRYPDLAYQPYTTGGGRGRWEWDMKRPRFIGEDFFGTGINPADYAMWGGEAAFQGKQASYPATALNYRMLTEGYRWGGYYGGWQFWAGAEPGPGQFKSNPPRAVFVRQWDWTFGSGQNVKRTFGLFNDTQHADPLTFTRTLLIGKRVAWTKKSEHKVAPGSSEKFDETIPMPVTSVTEERIEAQLVVKLEAGGKEIFRDAKTVSLLPDGYSLGKKIVAAPPVPAKPANRNAANTPINNTKYSYIDFELPRPTGKIALFDPSGKLGAFFKTLTIPVNTLNSLENLPTDIKILVVGPDALSVEESTSSRLAAFASSGKRIIILEQKNPLKYQGLPAEIEPASEKKEGSVGFMEDENHPAFKGLKQKDFFTWGADGVLYRDIYNKPARGAKSLLQAGPRLTQSALVEVPVGSGLMLLSQLEMGEKIGDTVVARQLLQNLLVYASDYKQEFRPVTVASDNAQLLKAVDAIGLQYQKADALAALGEAKTKLLLVSATPANLKTLAGNLEKVNAFTGRGGYIVFHGLTPEGLSDYNKIVGFDHMIRPFKRERVTFPVARNPLTSGLTLGDVVMLSGERIFLWTSDEYVANDEFSYVVDYEDVAPFAKSSSFLFDNATNNFFQADGWKLINNFDAPKEGPAEIPLDFPKPVTIKEFTWVGNTLYSPQTRVNLVFDGKDTASFKTEPNAEAQTFPVAPPRSGQKITLQIAEWQVNPEKSPNGKVIIGIDNFNLNAARPADFYQKVKPLLNIGGLMQYPRGPGGMLLCNVNFKDTEAVPVNTAKKRTILATLLRNLQAPFAGKTIIAGANLAYAPIEIGKQATQFRNERGWFGDKNFTFAGLPTGKQTFSGVPFDVYDLLTSPVPTAIMLGGNGIPNNPPQSVKGIPVGRKADALFFLQSARIDQRMNNDDRQKNRKFEMARYIVHYEGGATETVPLYSEIDVENYRQKTPLALPGAQIGWTKPYENGEFAVAYVKQWTNPKPETPIESIDLEYGPDKRGVPVLLAVTAASAVK